MENKSKKYKSISEKLKKITNYIFSFPKKDKVAYNLKSIRVPRISGRALKILVTIIRIPVIRLY